jgi:hypothetical protein
MERVFHPPQLIGTKVEDAYFCSGLGQVVRNSSHRKEIIRERGLIEVGNERPEKHLKPTHIPYDV